MEAISKLIKDYENKLIDIDQNRQSDDKAGDHSFYMEYNTAKENINEFIGELKKLQALTIQRVSQQRELLIGWEKIQMCDNWEKQKQRRIEAIDYYLANN